MTTGLFDRTPNAPSGGVVRGPIITKVPTRRYDELLRCERELAIYMRSIEHVRRYQAVHIQPLGLQSDYALGWHANVKAWCDGIAAAAEEIGPSDV